MLLYAGKGKGFLSVKTKIPNVEGSEKCGVNCSEGY
jgi:hypothetical protein